MMKNNNNIDSILNEVKGKRFIPNFVVLFFVISLLAIDFFPYFKSMEIINPQFLYLSLINLLIGIYFYCNFKLISSNIILVLRRSYICKIYLLFLFFCIISLFVAKNTSLVLTKLTQLVIVFCLFINLVILLKDKLNLIYKIVFIVSISAFFQSWQQLLNFINISNSESLVRLLSDMKGNTGNINILAASLTIKIPFLLIGISYFNGFKKWFLLFTMFSVITIIFLTGARTPLISLFSIFFVYFAYLLKQYSFCKSTIYKNIIVIIPVIFSILFSNMIFRKVNENSRYVSLENKIGKISAEDSSSQARLAYWNNALKMSQTSPILGIGLGNYQIESIPYEKTISDDSVVSLHAHNDFMEIAAETGIVNGIIYFSLFVFIFFINCKRIFKSDDSNKSVIALLALLILIVYGIDSVFNFPMYRPTMQIFFSLLLAITVINSGINHKEFEVNISNTKILYSILVSIALMSSYAAFLIYKASNLEYLIASDDINMKTEGAYLSGDEVVARMPKFPNVFQSSEAFYEYAGIYYVREKKYDKALNSFSKASKINPYAGRINFYKHIISREKGNIDSAYVYIKEAFYLRPRDIVMYKNAIYIAGLKGDTIEILKEHKIFSKYRAIPEAWNSALVALQQTAFSRKSLVNFVDQGLKILPQDSTLIKSKNDLLITNYIIEGQSFIHQSKLDKGLISYQKALKIDPENIYVMQNMGFFYYNLGQNEKAINYFLNALKYSGLEDGKTEFYLSVCYLKNNDKENACKYLNLSRDKKFPNALLPAVHNTCK